MRKCEIFVQPSHEDVCAALRGQIDLFGKNKGDASKRLQMPRHLQPLMPLSNAKVGNIRTA